MSKTFYQPFEYYDDGTNIEYGDIPSELASFEVFISEDDCIDWLKKWDYNPGDFIIREFDEDDIEEPTIIDSYGFPIDELNESNCTDLGKPITKDYYKDTPTSDLFAIVAEQCQVETILSVAEGYVATTDAEMREFLFACLGFDIE